MDANNVHPSLLGYADNQEFDYAAFFQPGDDLGFPQQSLQQLAPHQHIQFPPALSPSPASGPVLVSDSSAGQDTPPSPDGSSKASTEPGPTSGQLQLQKQRLERRGHTKSRRGCYNCKRRRIKCQETHPACGHCVKTGLKCEYPAMPQIIHQPHNQIPLFSLQDMRFFQHFLTHCYPHHPLKQEDVWTHEIPCIAHNHEFLMHAILGFAASELISTDSSLTKAAMTHRIKAIRAIKKRLADPGGASSARDSGEEANAMVATCFALTFQSIFLDDGLAEYMTFIRGITIVVMQMMFRGITPVFSTILEEKQDELLEPLMRSLPLIRKGWTDSAMEAINGLRPLCVEPVEIEYWEKLSDIVENLYVSSWTAYKAHTRQYGWWMMLPHHLFQELISPDNQVVMLLHSHAIAITQIMVLITSQDMEVRQKSPTDTSRDEPCDPGFLRWLRYLNTRIDYEHQMYNQWPVWVEDQLNKDLTFFGKVTY